MATSKYAPLNSLQVQLREIKKEIYEFEKINAEDPIERAFIDHLHAYEHTLYEKNNKRQRSRIRTAWKNNGIKMAVENAVRKGTPGFDSLKDAKKTGISFEMLVVTQHEHFDLDLVEIALRKLGLAST
jgi:hypothetical protein